MRWAPRAGDETADRITPRAVRGRAIRVRPRRAASVSGHAARRRIAARPGPTARDGAIFLDKDGTILRDVPYNVIPARMRFASGAAAALTRWARADAPLIVISNQAGVARGRIRLPQLAPMARQLERMFARQGARLESFEYCPYHPDGVIAAFARESSRRKPAPGMLRDAARHHRVALARSWFVGDILDDVEAGNRAGCRTLLIDNGNETLWRGWHARDGLRRPFALARDLRHAAAIIAATRRAPHRAFACPEPRRGARPLREAA